MDKYERFRRVHSIWSWLPAFRAAAESESLKEASHVLQVSRPAISRTIRLVEEKLGIEIFDRSGRSLVLTEEGQILLDGVRDAMRRVDDQLDQIFGQMPTTVHLAMTPSLSSHLGRIHELLNDAEMPMTLNVSSHEVAVSAVRQGQVDLILMFEELVDDDRSIELVSVGEVNWRLCAPGSHPAHGSGASLEALVSEYPLVAMSDQHRLSAGPIPAMRSHPLAVVSSVSHLEEFARRLGAPAIFPDSYELPDDFEEFDVQLRPTPVVGIRRSRLQDKDIVDRLIELVRLN